MNKNKQPGTLNNSIITEDDTFFDNYLQGNSELSGLYQETDCAPPSHQIDQNILTAAQASTAEQKATKRPSPLAWAASIAIFSLAGLLTLNTWQAEQELPPPVLSKTSAPIESADVLQQESSYKNINKETKNDTRQLLYTSQPAPIMPAASQKMTGMSASHESISISSPKIIQEQTSFHLTEQEIELNKIQTLINQNKLDKAYKLFEKFNIKYPDYTVDPVILQKMVPH